MISAQERAPLAKPATPAPVPSEDPSKRVDLFLQIVEDGKLVPYGSIDLKKGDLEQLAELIEHFASTRPKTVAKLTTKPGTKFIVVKVDPTDKDFIRQGGEPLILGEVLTTPELVQFLKIPGSKINASLVRYYSKEHKPFEHGGYTLRLLEDFLKDLKGPTSKDHQAVAIAHGAWAEEYQVTPFQ